MDGCESAIHVRENLYIMISIDRTSEMWLGVYIIKKNYGTSDNSSYSNSNPFSLMTIRQASTTAES